jgi:hypothetical protein
VRTLDGDNPARLLLLTAQQTYGRHSAERRVYLGGKGSLEAWIEPRDDGRSWTFRVEDAPAVYALADADRKAFAVHTLHKLASALNVWPADLAHVPFDAIAALHTADPADNRRMPTGPRRARDTGYRATSPDITVPATEFAPRAQAHSHRRRRVQPATPPGTIARVTIIAMAFCRNAA